MAQTCEYTDKELKLLNSNKGLKLLLESEKPNPDRALRMIKYERRLAKLQEELIKLQTWVLDNDERVCVLFEGRDAAGKGGPSGASPTT